MADVKKNTFNVRIKNKYDSYENWASAGVILEAGEIAIAYTTVDVKVDNGTAKHPALLMKVGDGEKTFAQLPWLSAKAADVLDACKDSAKLTEFVNGVIADAGIASDEAMEALAGRVKTLEDAVDEDTQYKIVANGANGFKLQSKGKTDEDWADVEGSTFTVDFSAVTGRLDAIESNIGEIKFAEEFAKYELKGVAATEAGKVQTALETYQGTNDAAVKANTDAIAAIKDDENIDSFADVVAALAGKQATGDYATKAEAQGYANAKNGDIAEAKAAGDNAQDAVDALAGKVGTVADGKTVVGLIDEAKTAAVTEATAHVAGVTGRLDALEGLVGDKNVAEELAKLETKADASEFKGQVAQYKTDNDARVKAIEDDYLTSADKTSLQEQINLIIENPDVEGVKNSINEFTAYIEEHGGIADGFRTDIDKNKEDIAAIAGDYLKAADKTELSGAIGGLDTRLGTAEGEIDALQADIVKKATKDELAAVEAKLPEEGTVTEYVAAELGKLETKIDIGSYAKASDLEALDDKVDALKIEDLGQAENTYIVFDCGTASTII